MAAALARGPPRRRRDRRLRARAADRLAAARRPEHRPHPAPRRVDRRGPGPRRRGGRRADPRRPRRPAGALRGQRPAPDARDGPGDRSLPAAGRDARPVLRPVRADRGEDADPRDRRRARRVRRDARSPPAVLRGLLETVTTERVNLVNAGALAKARGHHRRRAQDAGGRPVRLAPDPVGRDRRHDDDGRRDAWPPASRGSSGSTTTRSTWSRRASMLVTRHHDRPGTMGRIGQHARRGRREHQRDAPGPDGARAPTRSWSSPSTTTSRPGSRTRSGRTRRSWTCGRSGSEPTAERAGPRRSRPSSTATLVLLRHGESTGDRRGPLPGPPRDAAVAARAAPGGARRRPARDPRRAAARSRSPARPPSRSSTRRSAGRPRPRPRRPRRWAPSAAGRSRPRCARSPVSLEIGQGAWEGLHRDEVVARYARRARGVAASTRPSRMGPGGEPLADVDAAGPRRARAASSRRWRPRRPAAARTARSVAGYRRAAPRTPRGRSSSATTASSRSRCSPSSTCRSSGSGRSRSRCAGSRVVEFRGGRAVLRAPQPDRAPRRPRRDEAPGHADGRDAQPIGAL